MPFADLPVAPAGEQNAPGDTICPKTEGVGVGLAGVGVGEARVKSNSGNFTEGDVTMQSAEQENAKIL